MLRFKHNRLLIVDKEWLSTGSVTQLVLAIISKDTRTPLERWVFDIHLTESAEDGQGEK